jgi:Protein of unknown function DUF72
VTAEGATVSVMTGTSGWQYRDWRGAFYPPRVPQRRWLEYYATQFATVENNGTFYRLASRDTFASWRDRVTGTPQRCPGAEDPPSEASEAPARRASKTCPDRDTAIRSVKRS